MAGIPAVLQAMLPNVEFTGGAVVRSCSVTVYLGESNISEDLKEIQDRVPEVDIGSYPFVKQNRYGTDLWWFAARTVMCLRVLWNPLKT